MKNTSLLSYFDKATDLIRNDISNNKLEIAGKVLIIRELARNHVGIDLSTQEGWKNLQSAEVNIIGEALWEIINDNGYFKAIPLESLVDLIDLANKEKIQNLTGEDFSAIISMMTNTRTSSILGYEPSFMPLFVERAKLDEGSKVYANSLSTLSMLGNVVGKASVYYETLERSSLVSAFRELFKNQVDVRFTDIYNKPTFIDTTGSLEKFDAGMTFPAIAGRIQTREIDSIVNSDTLNRFSVFSRSTEILAIQHTLAQVNGIVIAFVSQGILFNAIEKPFREFIISERMLKEIIFLPSGSLNSTHIATAMLVFDTRGGCDNVRFIDLSLTGHIQKNRRNIELIDVDKLLEKIVADTDFEGIANISYEQIKQEDYSLTAQRYALTKEQQQFNQLIQETNTSELVELVSFERAPPVFNRDAKGQIPVFEVSFADMEDGYLKAPSKETLVSKRTIDEYDKSFLQPKDIIIATKGNTLGRVALVPDDAPPAGKNGWIVSQFALILRVKKNANISPEALFVYLRSPLGQKMIARFSEGSVMSTLSLSNLKTLSVVKFTEEEQTQAKLIVENDLKNIKQIQQLKQEIEQRYQDMWYLNS